VELSAMGVPWDDSRLFYAVRWSTHFFATGMGV
jgi:hypothetical protein